MSESLLRELAERIAREQFLSQWPIYLLMLALAFVGGALASYFSSYFKKRGEALATKSDFNDLLIQIKATTAATEEVKLKVSHMDWTTKERTLLKRTKLEELLLRLHELADWQETKRLQLMYNGEPSPSLSPLPKVSLLLVLYFPDLRLEIGEYLNIHRKIMILLTETKLKILHANNDIDKINTIREPAAETFIEHYRTQLLALGSIENRCNIIMDHLIS